MTAEHTPSADSDPALPPHRGARGFHNPPGSVRARGTPGEWLRLLRELSFGPRSLRHPAVPAGHVLDETAALATLAALAEADTLTWLGHACFLIRIGGQNVLTDPYLSDYASPLPGFGPKRYAGTGIGLAQLPPIDLILLSHNHYDHFDAPALRQLASANRDARVVVPLGLARPMRQLGFRQADELDWGEVCVCGALLVTALPAVHFSSRTPFDRNKTLWCGFSLVSPQHRIYFAGDTGWGPVFEHAGARFGPFDLGLLPIGAYDPRALMQAVHANPEEAVRIGSAMRASRLVAMHWGTVALTTEPAFEPPQRFRAAAEAAGFADDQAWIMKIGETRAL